jgi:hypothetical protein
VGEHNHQFERIADLGRILGRQDFENLHDDRNRRRMRRGRHRPKARRARRASCIAAAPYNLLGAARVRPATMQPLDLCGWT